MNTPIDALIAAARLWLAADPDPATRESAEAMIAKRDAAALQACFGERLQFGTAGIRGELGPGPGRLNRRLAGLVAGGLARVLQQRGQGRDTGVVVARDGRRGSPEFSDEVCRVLQKAGWTVYRFDQVSPTPLAAFAVKLLGAAAGVVVTASHNPPQYNGIKVFAPGGAQIIAPLDAEIAQAMLALESGEAPFLSEAGGRLVLADEIVEAAYLAALRERLPWPKAAGASLKVVYTPMHGVGGRLALKTMASPQVQVEPVMAQFEPDGSFPTVRFPNPEEPGALDMAHDKAWATKADLVIANDPDADRLAVSVRSPEGQMRPLGGNEIGILLADHAVRSLQARWALPAEAGVVTTVVSSRMLRALAARDGLTYRETLTGFKWLAEAMRAMRAEGCTPIYGYEEALGYLVSPDMLLDKDGLGAARAFVQMALALKAEGQTVLERLDALHKELGVFVSRGSSIWVDGGLGRMTAMMAALRGREVNEIAGLPVVWSADFLAGQEKCGGRSSPLKFPASDLLAFETKESRLIIRPSGTEPKLKMYAEHWGMLGAHESLAACRQRLGEAAEKTLARAKGLLEESL